MWPECQTRVSHFDFLSFLSLRDARQDAGRSRWLVHGFEPAMRGYRAAVRKRVTGLDEQLERPRDADGLSAPRMMPRLERTGEKVEQTGLCLCEDVRIETVEIDGKRRSRELP